MPHATGLYCEEHGPVDAPPLILSSGLGGSGSYWAPNLPALARRHRVIAYDHRGTGMSDRAVPDGLSVATMADDVLALMDALDIAEAAFIGHALGGMIGLALAAGSCRLSRLVIVNGWLALDPHTARCFDIRLDLLRHAGAEAYLRAQPLFLYPPDWISAHDDRLTAEAAAQLAHFPASDTIEKRIAAVRAFRMDQLEAPPCPLLAIATRDDMLVPFGASAAVASRLPGARLATLPWGGHACNVTDPDRFNAIVLDFLES